MQTQALAIQPVNDLLSPSVETDEARRREFLVSRANARHERIQKSVDTIVYELIAMKETGDWAYVTPPDGVPFRTWTDYLSRGHRYSRKHLTELIKAAPVQEVLEGGGFGGVNHSVAYELTKHPQELWLPIMHAATARERVTESGVRQIGEILTQATAGYVVIGSNAQPTPIDAALADDAIATYERQLEHIATHTKTQRVYIVRRTEATLTQRGNTLMIEVPLPENVQLNEQYFVAVWREEEIKDSV